MSKNGKADFIQDYCNRYRDNQGSIIQCGRKISAQL